MAQTRNESGVPNVMQQPPQVQNMPTQRYDLTQPLMPPPGNGMSNLLDTSENRQQDVGLIPDSSLPFQQPVFSLSMSSSFRVFAEILTAFLLMFSVLLKKALRPL